MKRPRPMFGSGTRMDASRIAAFCGIAAIAVVLVAVLIGPRLQPSAPPPGLVPLETGSDTGRYDLFVVQTDGALTIFEQRDGSDATPFSPADIERRLRQAKNQQAPINRALLVIAEGTSVQDLQERITELNRLGINSVAVAAELPEANP